MFAAHKCADDAPFDVLQAQAGAVLDEEQDNVARALQAGDHKRRHLKFGLTTIQIEHRFARHLAQ